MGEDTQGRPQQISVSRDALRADLAEMELRIKSFIAVELDKKAGAEQVRRLQSDVDSLKQGNFTEAQRLAIIKLFQDNSETKDKNRWTGRERIIGVVALVVALVSLAFTALYTVDVVNNSNPPAVVK